MKYTYNKMLKECEKKVLSNNLEVHTVKWLFFNSDFFCGYSNLNNEVSEEVKDKFNKMIDLYIKEKMPPQYILNKVFFFNYPFYVDEGCFIPRPETEQLVEETIYRIDDISVSQTLGNKIFGVGTIKIYCQDASGDEVLIKNVKEPYKVRAMINDLVESARTNKKIVFGEFQ